VGVVRLFAKLDDLPFNLECTGVFASDAVTPSVTAS
jgi:hypothetical protein